MKTLKLKKPCQTPDQAARISLCVKTVDGLEEAHINMATGEITYGKDACIDEHLLRKAFAEQGLELETPSHT